MKNFLKNIIKYFIPWMNQNEKIYALYKKSNNSFKNSKKAMAFYYMNKIYKRYGCIISPSAEIGYNFKLPHPVGVVIGEGVKIGNNCIIYQNVTLGRKNRDIAEYPAIGDNVTIYCNSVLVGNINIGDNTIIGCNSTILRDVEPNSRCVGVVK